MCEGLENVGSDMLRTGVSPLHTMSILNQVLAKSKKYLITRLAPLPTHGCQHYCQSTFYVYNCAVWVSLHTCSHNWIVTSCRIMELVKRLSSDRLGFQELSSVDKL